MYAVADNSDIVLHYSEKPRDFSLSRFDQAAARITLSTKQ